MVQLEILPMVPLVANGTIGIGNHRTLNVSRQQMVPLVPLVETLVPMVPLVVPMVPLVSPILALFGVLPIVPLVILPMVPLVANSTIGKYIGLPMVPIVPLGEPIPIIGKDGVTSSDNIRVTLTGTNQ